MEIEKEITPELVQKYAVGPLLSYSIIVHLYTSIHVTFFPVSLYSSPVSLTPFLLSSLLTIPSPGDCSKTEDA